MHIVCTFDKNYMPHAATMLCSALKNTEDIDTIHLIHKGIKPKELTSLKEFISHFEVEVKDYDIDGRLFSNLPVDKHFSHAIYYRLMLPEILPKSLEKVLYLDSDMIVLKSLKTLWDFELKDSSVAAVENPGNGHNQRLGIPQDRKYFNSGVLLIDLPKWREHRVHLRAIEFVENNPEKIEFPDQDGLNAVLFDEWAELPLTWNVQHTFFLNPCYKSRYPELVKDPSIVHFSGENLKPWQASLNHPFKKEYRRYRSETPWRSFKLDGQTSLIFKLKEESKKYGGFLLDKLGRKKL